MAHYALRNGSVTTTGRKGGLEHFLRLTLNPFVSEHGIPFGMAATYDQGVSKLDIESLKAAPGFLYIEVPLWSGDESLLEDLGDLMHRSSRTNG